AMAAVGCSTSVTGGLGTMPDSGDTGGVGAPVGTVAPDGTPQDSACGETELVALELSGVALTADGAPAAGAEVWLEQRDWGPTEIHGSGLADDAGRFRFAVTEVPIVAGCWGIGPQFWASASHGGATGEVAVNMQVVMAWLDGSGVADLSDVPVVCE
ncbi:MAG: hypothetical protein ABMB14_33410, partial [Myxococcota bacterium]